MLRREERRPRKRRHVRREARHPEREDIEYEQVRRGRGIRQLVGLITVVFMGTLGVVVGTRLSSDAIAVLVGVIAGVAASIPCALLLMAVTRRQEERDEGGWDEDRYDDRYDGRYDGRYGDPRRAVPPVIVVTSGQASQQQLPPWASDGPGWSGWDENIPSRTGRTFRVMGYDESDDEE